MENTKKSQWIDATGDACAGDTIKFTEKVFGGNWKNSQFLGERTIVAEIVRHTRSKKNLHHTFTMIVMESEGTHPLAVGAKIRRLGFKLNRNGVDRQNWSDEGSRQEISEQWLLKLNGGLLNRWESDELLANQHLWHEYSTLENRNICMSAKNFKRFNRHLEDAFVDTIDAAKYADRGWVDRL